MTTNDVVESSSSAPQMTAAALEFLDTIIGLAGTMAPHTRHSRFLESAGTQALSGLMDGLDTYYRRLRELIDPSNPAPSESYKNRKWLDACLGPDCLSEEQQQYNAMLKDVRNLSVHNNGYVDKKFKQKHIDVALFTVGEQIPTYLYAALAAPAIMTTLINYECRVLEIYPHLGISAPLEHLRKFGSWIEDAENMINPTKKEWEIVESSLEHYNSSGLPYTFNDMALRSTRQGFGQRWSVEEAMDGIYLISRRRTAVGPFIDEEAVDRWINGRKMMLKCVVIRNENENGWVSITTLDGLNICSHPEELKDLFEDW